MWLKTFFYLQKNDRRGAIALLIFIFIAVIIIFGVGGGKDKSDSSGVDSLNSPDETKEGKSSVSQYYNVDGRRAELFRFDPNTADSTQLLRLGLQPWQVRNIYKYRAAGGVYREPRDFARLYGLTKKQYLAMEPYIRISSDYEPASKLYSSNRNYDDGNGSGGATQSDSMPPRQHSSTKLHPGQHIPLNTSDSTELMKVPGIGIGYACAIINYRNRLGGFANVNQLMDIGGLPSSALAYFTVSSATVHKLNVNKLTLNQLRRHPYLNFYQARDICDYRRVHGPIKNINQLRGSENFTSDVIARLEPYIEY